MQREIELNYEPQSYLAAIRRYWLSSEGWFYLTVSALLGVVLYLSANHRQAELLTGFTAGALSTMFLFAGWGYTATIREARVKAERFSSLKATLQISEAGLQYRAGDLVMEIGWAAIEAIQRTPTMWWLLKDRAVYMMLPCQSLDEECQQFIITQVKSHGGQVL
jgi:hypothetical protein